MARQLDVPSTTYQPGTYQFTIDHLRPTSDGFYTTLSRENWPAGAVGYISCEISSDEGATFHPWFGQDLLGGVILDKFGNPITTVISSGEWPGENDGSGGRRVLRQSDIRVTLTVTQALTTAIHIEDF
jgi:hypothetical protein